MKTIEEIGRDLANIEISNNIIGLISWLAEETDESQKILRDYVISNLHMDMHLDIILQYMMGQGIFGITKLDNNEIGGYIGYKGKIYSRETGGHNNLILKKLLRGEKKDYNDLIQYVKEVYQPDVMGKTSIMRAGAYSDKDEFDEEALQQTIFESEICKHKEGLSDEQISDLKIRIKQAVLERKSCTEENKKLEKINQIIFSLIEKYEEYEFSSKSINDKEKRIEEVKQILTQYSSRTMKIANALRPIVGRLNNPKSNPDNKLPTSINKKNIFRQAIDAINFMNQKEELIQTSQEDKRALDEHRKKLYDETREAVAEMIQNCNSVIYKQALEAVLIAIDKGARIEYLKGYLYYLSFQTFGNEDKMKNGYNANEYSIYQGCASSIEKLAEDIKNNMKIGKKLFSPEVLQIKDFEKICLMIRTLLQEENISEIDGNKDYGSTETEYRRKCLKTPGIELIGLSLNHDEIKVKMGELNQRYIKLLQTDDIEEYVRGVADLVMDFIILHPYMDGNGRTSRALFTVLMAQKGIVAPALISSYNDRYNRTEFTYYSETAAIAVKNGNQEKIKEAYKNWENYVIKRVVKYNPELREKLELNPQKNSEIEATSQEDIITE